MKKMNKRQQKAHIKKIFEAIPDIPEEDWDDTCYRVSFGIRTRYESWDEHQDYPYYEKQKIAELICLTQLEERVSFVHLDIVKRISVDIPELPESQKE